MILTDSGFWVALGDERDSYHLAANAAFWRWADEGFATTWAVLAEVSYILSVRASLHQALNFVHMIGQGAAELPELGRDSVLRIAELMHRYRNLPMDFADASLVVLAEQLHEGRILSSDYRDFSVYRWEKNRPFVNLL